MADRSQESHWCGALFQERAAGLILYGRALGLGHGESEDVVQEVFRGLLRLPAPPAQPERYLLRAFRNRAMNHRRSVWRRLTRELESRSWFEPSEERNGDERIATDLLLQLPPEQREVIVLKLWHRRTFEEIGTLLEISPNTAAGRYRYGLQRLRTAFRNTDREESHGSESRCLGSLAGGLDAATPVGGA